MDKDNLATLLGVTQAYVDFNREERNYAALLYHHLMSSGAAMDRFLQLVAPGVVCEPGYPHLYFEYAHARDLWKHAHSLESPLEPNARYFNAIVGLLKTEDPCGVQAALEHVVGCSVSGESLQAAESNIGTGGSDRGPPVTSVAPGFVAAFNKFMVAGPKSTKHLQSPARWSATALGSITDRKLRESACHLKWGFNAKADLVIHTGRQTAVCVELKVDSKTSTYSMPSTEVYTMPQLALQQYVLETLLGFTTTFAMITRTESLPVDPKVKGLTWSQVFKAILGTEFPEPSPKATRFADRMVQQICMPKARKNP